MPERPSRRALLHSIGGAVAGGLAGCTSDDGPRRTPSEHPPTTEGSTTEPPNSAASDPESDEPGEPWPEHFVEADGTGLTLDGEPYYVNGVGSCCFITAGGSRPAVDEIMADAEAVGTNAIRTRAYGCFNHGGTRVCFQPEPGEYSERAFELLDYAVAKAKEHRIRLVLSPTNAWSGPPGGTFEQYVEWSQTAETHDDFFTDDGARRLYKEFLRHLLTRENTITGVEYRDEPAILMWDLGNEVHAEDASAADDLQGWIEEMAAFVKELDPNHLLTPGHLGYHDRQNGAESGLDFVENHEPEHVDVCSFRVYNQNVGYQSHQEPVDEWEAANRERVLPWIEDHVTAAHELVGKPAFVEEFGWKVDRTAENLERRERIRRRIYRGWYERFAELDVAGAMMWGFVTDEHRENWNTFFELGYPKDEETLALIEEYDSMVERAGNGG